MNEELALAAGILALAIGIILTLRATRAGRAVQTRTMGRDRSAAKIDHEDALAEEIIERLSEGVLVLDSELRPLVVNAAGRRMLGFQNGTIRTRLPSEEVLEVARRVKARAHEVDDIVTTWFPARSKLRVRAIPLSGSSGGVLVTLQDVTQELLSQQVRREFVSHASHELKSPVAGLQTLAEAIRDAARDDPDTAERFSQRLVDEASRLAHLVSDLLDLSKLEEPGHSSKTLVNLSALAEAELDRISASASAKAISLIPQIHPGISVQGDEEQLGLLLRNLLDNAIRYTPDHGKVALDLSLDNGNAAVTVTDSGIGIPVESQKRVFERFYRVDRARSRDRGGTGLGLAIVKHVAESHGGDVSVRSQLGEGSSFVARLPVSRPGPDNHTGPVER